MTDRCEAAPVPEPQAPTAPAAGAAGMDASAPPGDGDWDVINEAAKGQCIALGPEGVLKVRLTWNSSSQGPLPDLDISALCFGRDGTLQEAIFYNQPAGLKRAVLLNSGDQQLGAVGEEIAVRLLSVLPNTTHIVFVVSSANDVPLTVVEGTVVSATLTNVPAGHPFSCDHIAWQQPRSPSQPAGRVRAHACAVPLYLARESGSAQHWSLRVLDEMAAGRTFIDALPRIRELCQLPASGKARFQAPVMLTKNEHLVIDTQTDADGMGLRVGCGWDPAAGAKASDLDLSVFCFGGADGRTLQDVVYWGKLSAFDGSVAHSGDNRTGEGAGDDETLLVRLQKVPLTVQSLVFLISNYGGAPEGAGLRSVRNAHFTVVRAADGAELVRFEALGEGLSENAPSVHGMLMGSLARLRGLDGAMSDRYWGLTCLSSGVNGSGVHDPAVLEAAGAAAAESSGQTLGSFRQVNLRGALRHLPSQSQGHPTGTAATAALNTQSPKSVELRQQLHPVWWRDPLVQAALRGAAKKVILFAVVVLLAYWFFGVGSGPKQKLRPKVRG